MNDIYSPENIARSRARAASIRRAVEDGILESSWLDTATEIEAYATEREGGPTERGRPNEADAEQESE